MITPMLYKDGYKVDHRSQYPEGTEFVYSNITPRGSRIEGVDKVVVFGIQYFIKDYLIRRFNEGFFKQPKEKIVASYKRRIDNYLGVGAVSFEHIADLHDLGYLPIRIKALNEGTLCPMRVPVLTIVNTHPKFFWLTNFLETILCNVIWGAMTSATTAFQYRKMLHEFAKETSDIPDFVQWQGHDFSMRGLMGLEPSLISGAAHLLSFTGTDTIPAIDFLENFYQADSDKELIGGSVPATEHSVMCLGGFETERETYVRLLTKVYPKGIVSIVSDTWDYWKVLTETLPSIKDIIMKREGKLVIRPDSGDPVKVICGDKSVGSDGLLPQLAVQMGTVELLWNTFGGTINSKGFRQLDPHVGVIYGDSITPERCRLICEGLKAKGFASTNIVFGIGSYTYQYVTRDTFGFAMKATWGVVDGKEVAIYKDPKTDSGIKKSAKGLLCVQQTIGGDIYLVEGVDIRGESEGLLKTVFEDGKLKNEQSLSQIRKLLLTSGGVL